MRLSSVIFMVLEAYLLAFLTLKTYVVLTAVPRLPNTILEIFLNCASFYIYLKLLLRRLWAWWVVFALNVMGLALAFSLLISRGEPFPWEMVLESAFMLVLLYANRICILSRCDPDLSQYLQVPEKHWNRIMAASAHPIPSKVVK